MSTVGNWELNIFSVSSGWSSPCWPMVNPPLHFEFRISISAEQGTTPTAEDTVRLQETPTDETPPPKKKEESPLSKPQLGSPL